MDSAFNIITNDEDKNFDKENKEKAKNSRY